MHIIFVCTGNTCRSPMAEALANQWLTEHHRDDVTCSSAGLYTEEGSPASEEAVFVMQEHGLDISSHRSHLLTPDDITEAGLFAVMTPSHAAVLSGAGVPPENIHVLGEGISDPFGGDEFIYRRCCAELREAVEDLLDQVCADE
ncbi:MAG: low molecular weight protein arginine phosphatase [Clostridiales bacterium]|nr:low molecular weight protein arginine phosphatase [Clostridiales bacterium]